MTMVQDGERKPILALWSAPRSRSTAFARMMVERGDLLVVHEPFSLVTDFGKATVGDQVVHSQQEVIDALRRTARHTGVFFKDTTDFHYPAVLADPAFLTDVIHTFIIRHPTEVIASHYALKPSLERDEVGIARLHEIFTAVRNATGATPVVVDSDDLLDQPEATVRTYCEAVGIPFLAQALSWQPGMRSEWQGTQRWHEATSQTSGFGRRVSDSPKEIATSPMLQAYVDFHLPFYEELYANALRPRVNLAI
jgi:hypothetical protein